MNNFQWNLDFSLLNQPQSDHLFQFSRRSSCLLLHGSSELGTAGELISRILNDFQQSNLFKQSQGLFKIKNKAEYWAIAHYAYWSIPNFFELCDNVTDYPFLKLYLSHNF
jgi:hypothetical protein